MGADILDGYKEVQGEYGDILMGGIYFGNYCERDGCAWGEASTRKSLFETKEERPGTLAAGGGPQC